MAEGMLDCLVCKTRTWQPLDPIQARGLQLSGAIRLPCTVCKRETSWVVSEYDRRLGSDRRMQFQSAKGLETSPDKEQHHHGVVPKPELPIRTERRGASQRRNKRVALQLPMRVRVNAYDLHFEEVTKTVNVSRSGVYFISSSPYEEGTLAYVSLNYFQEIAGSNIEQRGKVVRVESPANKSRGVAIELT